MHGASRSLSLSLPFHPNLAQHRGRARQDRRCARALECSSKYSKLAGPLRFPWGHWPDLKIAGRGKMGAALREAG